MSQSDKPRRRWFRFSLRTLLVLVTVASAGFGWLGVKMRQAQAQREAVETIQALGGDVSYDYEFDSDGVRLFPLLDPATLLFTPPTPPGPKWLRAWLGDDLFTNVIDVHLYNTGTTDAVLMHLASLTRLKSLTLDLTQVTDAGLAYLGGLNQLEYLSLNLTQVTDAGLVHLEGLEQLKKLRLYRTQVTDAGLVRLAGLEQLEGLWISETQVTDAGCEQLKKDLPRLEIIR